MQKLPLKIGRGSGKIHRRAEKRRWIFYSLCGSRSAAARLIKKVQAEHRKAAHGDDQIYNRISRQLRQKACEPARRSGESPRRRSGQCRPQAADPLPASVFSVGRMGMPVPELLGNASSGASAGWRERVCMKLVLSVQKIDIHSLMQPGCKVNARHSLKCGEKHNPQEKSRAKTGV